MTVYVDSMKAKHGRMKMCHLISDTEEELHQMADDIKVDRKWHQGDHYDICLSKRALAVSHGAVEVTWMQASAMHLVRKITGELPSPESAKAELRELLREKA